jgi:hypothetical protein
VVRGNGSSVKYDAAEWNGAARGWGGREIRRERETLSESIILSAVYLYLLGNSVASQDVTIFQE